MRRPFHRHPAMPLQRYLADPARGDGSNAAGIPGDCYRTALAGALGLTRDAVPHFVQFREVEAGWFWELQRWAAAQYGRNVYTWNVEVWRKARAAGTAPLYPGGRPYVVASGPSPRGAFHHAIVTDLDLEPVHDPHPLGMGLARLDTVDVFVAADWTPPRPLALEAAR